jgi:dTDP-4-amino-4,6-dideoxy-D-galactose acyltransferase
MQTAEPCEFLPWDTSFFGLRIARVVGHRFDPQRVEAVLEWCTTHEIEYLHFLATLDHQETIRLAEDHGFRLVDVRVTLQCSIGDRAPRHGSARPRGGPVRPSRPRDIPILQKIARTSYGDSRFCFDPCFPVESCDALYDTRIKRGCEGYADAVLVAEMDARPAGYVSCHLLDDEPRGQIGLVGVASQARFG